jgi:hypothetical protein
MEDKPLKTEGEEPKPPLHDLSVQNAELKLPISRPNWQPADLQ